MYVADAPDRLLGLGSVPARLARTPPTRPRRCLDELGLAGIAIGSRGGGRDLDDPVNDELWALLAERRTFVFLHPSGVPGRQAASATSTCRSSSATRWRPRSRSPGWCSAACWSGTRSPCAWRTAAAACPRCADGWTWAGSARTSPAPRRCRPSAYADRLYYDTAVFSTTLLRRLVEDVGVGHVLLGTDHPFELADVTPIQTVRDLGLDEASTRGHPVGQRRAGCSVSPPWWLPTERTPFRRCGRKSTPRKDPKKSSRPGRRRPTVARAKEKER